MIIDRAGVRELDRRAVAEFGVPSIVLMENAGRAAAQLLLRLGVGGPVVVCCGKGNNGGDGFVVARHLDRQKLPVRVLLFADPSSLRGDAGTNYRIATRSKIPVTANPANVAGELAGAAWVVDALFGTGLTGPVRAPLDQVIAAINASRAQVLAIDIPSGLDCDTGEPLGPTVRAHHTATFVAEKRGFTNPQAAEWTGRVHVSDIGAPRILVEQYLK